MSKFDFEVLTPAGSVIFTSPDRDLARAFAKERNAALPGLNARVEEVERIENRRVVYRDRSHLRLLSEVA